MRVPRRLFVCLFACIHVCVHVYIYIYIYIYVSKPNYKATITNATYNLQHTGVLRLRLIRGEAPMIVHDELVLVHAPGQILDNGELVPGADHGDLLPPPVEGGREVHVLPTVRPREDDWDEVILLCYTILYYTILSYTTLYHTILYYTILYYTILYYTILYYPAHPP